MNKNTTLEQLNNLRLTGMAKRYEASLALPSHQQEDAHSLLAMLCKFDELQLVKPASDPFLEIADFTCIIIGS